MRSGEDGNVLILVPTAVLVMLALGAMALDAAHTFLVARQLGELASDVATEGAAAIDVGAFYGGDGAIVLEPGAVARRRDVLVGRAERSGAFVSVACPEVAVVGTEVRAGCVARARPPLLASWRGAGAERELVAHARARGVRGP